jgi:hypothetical protein
VNAYAVGGAVAGVVVPTIMGGASPLIGGADAVIVRGASGIEGVRRDSVGGESVGGESVAGETVVAEVELLAAAVRGLETRLVASLTLKSIRLRSGNKSVS